MKASRGYPAMPSPGYMRLIADAEITACLSGVVVNGRARVEVLVRLRRVAERRRS